MLVSKGTIWIYLTQICQQYRNIPDWFLLNNLLSVINALSNNLKLLSKSKSYRDERQEKPFKNYFLCKPPSFLQLTPQTSTQRPYGKNAKGLGKDTVGTIAGSN